MLIKLFSHLPEEKIIRERKGLADMDRVRIFRILFIRLKKILSAHYAI